MYSSYTAASFARKHDLAARRGVNLEGALTWAFEFEGHPYFAGFRSLATNGINKPVLNVFRMLAKMSGERLSVESDSAVSLDDMLRRGVRDKPDVSAFASRDGDTLWVMVWHYHDNDLAGPAAEVSVELSNLPEGVLSLAVENFLIDAAHSNAYTAWLKMGSPQSPTAEQYAELERSGQLASGDAIAPVAVEGGAATVKLSLPRQGVALLVMRGGDPD
jgi:xylan 1,4-beta-xylosidase